MRVSQNLIQIPGVSSSRIFMEGLLGVSISFSMLRKSRARRKCISLAVSQSLAFTIRHPSLCAFCKEEVESLEHLICLCKVTKTFWNTFFSWLNTHSFEEVHFTVVNILFGFFDISKDFHLLNHLVLLANQFIYRCKLNRNQPSFKVFLAKIKTVYEMEHLIAKDRNQLPKHFSNGNESFPYKQAN